MNSGDVSIFYRAFGTPGRTPILLLHGSNYYDSYDWIGVASALATDRLVVTPDRRGWGETTWSPSKDYSRDALVDDMLAVMKATQMNKPIVIGHSGCRSGDHLVCGQPPRPAHQSSSSSTAR